MGFTLWNLVKAGLLVTNALAILHKKRFLSKCESEIMDHKRRSDLP
jgi:hypothetical protein